MRRSVWGLILVIVVAAGCATGQELSVERAPGASTTPTTVGATTTRASSAATTSTSAPTTQAPTTTDAPTTTEAPSTSSPPSVRAATAGTWTTAPYHGFGAWLDAFDWSISFADSTPVGVEAIDHMAAEGVQTLYIQATRWDSSTAVIEPERLQALIDRAHAHDIAVVAWYLPTLVDPADDLRRILALADLDIEGLAIDIESRDVDDVAERNRRLVDLSAAIRRELPDQVIGGIVLPPVVMEDVNPNYWPGFPWEGLAPHYDVWLPMSYWTNRIDGWRSSYAYTGTNIARVRERIGREDALVHTIGGIGDKTSLADIDGMVTAAVEHAAIGGSIYDYRTSRAEFWAPLRAFRAG